VYGTPAAGPRPRRQGCAGATRGRMSRPAPYAAQQAESVLLEALQRACEPAAVTCAGLEVEGPREALAPIWHEVRSPGALAASEAAEARTARRRQTRRAGSSGRSARTRCGAPARSDPRRAVGPAPCRVPCHVGRWARLQRAANSSETGSGLWDWWSDRTFSGRSTAGSRAPLGVLPGHVGDGRLDGTPNGMRLSKPSRPGDPCLPAPQACEVRTLEPGTRRCVAVLVLPAAPTWAWVVAAGGPKPGLVFACNKFHDVAGLFTPP